jgi:molecular chaperone GrpE (heat shock protein)
MARGWESKSVESQIESAGAPADRSALTPEQRRTQQKRESLELSRRRILREIETARSEVRHASLQQALDFLDREIAGLG